MRPSKGGRVAGRTGRGTAPLMFAMLLAFRAAARADATIQGRVTDTTGSPLPAVTIEVRSASRPIERTTSGDDGRYVVKGLAAGVYEVSFELTGFVRPRDATSRSRRGAPSTWTSRSTCRRPRRWW
jgi:Carboxypeptidase regulatory-like domain